MVGKNSFYAKYIKRILDVVLSSIALYVLGIPMLIVALIIRITMGKPVLFKQKRIGKNEKRFVLLKFRSMKDVNDENGIPKPDSQRLTKFGKIIRKASIDELPSLINIIKGDMSIVGPRPLPTVYLPWYNEIERQRHDVRGGLTGLAQINGRNLVSWSDRFSYDVQYVNEISFLKDVQIILKTVVTVLEHKDVGVRGKGSIGDFDVERSGLSEVELNEMAIKNGWYD